MLTDVKGLTRTVGGSGVGLSSVRIGLRDGVANRECGGGLVTTGGGCIVVGDGEGQTRPSGEMHGIQWGNARDTVGGGHIGGTLDIGGAGVIGYGIGGTGS